jgi:hypothetical protein
MKKILLIIFVLFFLVLSLNSEIYIKAKVQFTDESSKNDSEGHAEVMQLWIGDNFCVQKVFDETFVMDLKKKEYCIVNLESKTYVAFNFPMNQVKLLVTDDIINKLRNYYKNFRVKKIEKTRKIGEWECVGYSMKGVNDSNVQQSHEWWITTDLDFNYRIFEEIQNRMIPTEMIRLLEYLNEEMPTAKMEGFLIEFVSTTKAEKSIRKSVYRVMEIAKKQLPKWMTGFPRDYKKVQFDEHFFKKKEKENTYNGLTDEAKYKATMGILKSIGTTIEDYILDFEKSPEGKTLKDIQSMLEPFYIKKLPLKDAWNNDIYYQYGTGSVKKSYWIGSAGTDGVFKGFSQKGTYNSINNNDLIYKDGAFVFCKKTE